MYKGMSVRRLLAALMLMLAGAAQAQESPVQRVLRTAPHLLAFVGSPQNLESLVTGLTRGTPVRLAAPVGQGQVKVTTFRPPAPMPVERVVAALESVRQELAQFGIQQPTTEQLLIGLNGGVLDLPSGSTEIRGVLAGAGRAPAPAALRSSVEPEWPPRRITPEEQEFAKLPPEVQSLLRSLPLPEALQKVAVAKQQLQALSIPSPSVEQLRDMVQRVLSPGSAYSAAGGSATTFPALSPLVPLNSAPLPAAPVMTSPVPAPGSSSPGY
jgi:hypothetical protein